VGGTRLLRWPGQEAALAVAVQTAAYLAGRISAQERSGARARHLRRHGRRSVIQPLRRAGDGHANATQTEAGVCGSAKARHARRARLRTAQAAGRRRSGAGARAAGLRGTRGVRGWAVAFAQRCAVPLQLLDARALDHSLMNGTTITAAQRPKICPLPITMTRGERSVSI